VRRSDVEVFAQKTRPAPQSGIRHSDATRAENWAFRLIAEHPGITAAELAEAMGESRRTAQGRLQHLDRCGLIVRSSGSITEPQQCHLTEAGWKRHRSELPLAKPA